MALVDQITGMDKRTVAKMVRKMRDSGVLLNAAQVAQFNTLLVPFNDAREAALDAMIISMTADLGSPNAVDASLDDAAKQAIIDEAVARLTEIRDAESSAATPAAGGATTNSQPRSNDQGVGGIVSRLLRGEIAPEIIATLAVGHLFNRDDDNDGRRAREAAEGAAGGAIREGEHAVVMTARRTGSVIGRFLGWVGLIILAFVVGMIIFGPSMLVVALVLVGVAVGLYAWLKSRFTKIQSGNRSEWLRKVGNELPVVLRLTGYTYTQLAGNNQRVFNAVLARLQDNLDSKNPFHNAREQQIDNMLAEVIARIATYYGQPTVTVAGVPAGADGVVKAQAAMSAPTFSTFPRALYEVELPDDPDLGDPGAESLMGRGWRWLNE